MNFSLCISHTPWVHARVQALAAMRLALGPVEHLLINDRDFRGTDWQVSKVQWALDQWEWSASQSVTHHVFMTDDLHIMPGFWDALTAMVSQSGEAPIGLLSNHPQATALERVARHWYRTNSWLVGPAYVLPHAFLLRFLTWFKARPEGNGKGCRGEQNDDSSINEFVSHEGGYTLHPLPTIIEHRNDITSTVGHGDEHSCERLSWRSRREVNVSGGRVEWVSEPTNYNTIALCEREYWAGAAAAPMLKVGA